MECCFLKGTVEGAASRRGFVCFLEEWVNLYEGLIVQEVHSRINRQ